MTNTENSLSSDETPEQGIAPQENLTHVIVKGGFKTLESNRKMLKEKGVTAAVVCPPGTDLNG